VFDFDFSKWTMFKYDEIKDREKLDVLESYVSKRLENMPIQYILNKAYFCGFPFFVDKSVLIPRFDTEVLAYRCRHKIPTTSFPALPPQ